MQSSNAKDKDNAALAALGVGGPKLLKALNNAGCLTSYHMGHRHLQGARCVCPNESPSLPWSLDAISHIADVHVWHLGIREIHVKGVITVSREAVAVGLCTTCCRRPMPLASGDDVEALAQPLQRDLDKYQAAN